MPPQGSQESQETISPAYIDHEVHTTTGMQVRVTLKEFPESQKPIFRDLDEVGPKGSFKKAKKESVTLTSKVGELRTQLDAEKSERQKDVAELKSEQERNAKMLADLKSEQEKMIAKLLADSKSEQEKMIAKLQSEQEKNAKVTAMGDFLASFSKALCDLAGVGGRDIFQAARELETEVGFTHVVHNIEARWADQDKGVRKPRSSVQQMAEAVTFLRDRRNLAAHTPHEERYRLNEMDKGAFKAYFSSFLPSSQENEYLEMVIDIF